MNGSVCSTFTYFVDIWFTNFVSVWVFFFHTSLDKPTTANPEKAEATQEIEDVVEINMKGMGKDMWQKFDWKLFSDKALRREFLNIPGKSTKSLSAGSAAKIILARGAGFGRTAKVAPKRILEGSVVTFHFVAKLKSGKIIDSSYFRPTPQICQVSRKGKAWPPAVGSILTFPGNLVDALNFCLIGMHVGEKALVRSTFHYAYGGMKVQRDLASLLWLSCVVIDQSLSNTTD